jgi:hypothetical protein
MNEPVAGPVIWVRGKRAALGPLRADLVSRYWEWENEPRSILGYGRQVRSALNQLRFTALRMIWLKVLEPNTPGIRAYTTAGFKPAGRLRQSGYWLGQPCDELIMDAVPEDYPGPSHFSE